MLTTKLFGARSESTSKPTTTENSDNNRIKRRHRKKTKHPHSQRQHARNLSSELGLPSSTDELTLSRPLRHLPNSSVNETKTTWSSSVFRRFSKRRQLKAESSEAFTIDPGFYRSPGETEYQSTRHIRANTMVEISNLSNTSLTAQPGPIASAACTCKPVSNHRWSRLSWPWQPASPPPLQLPGSCDIHSPLPSPIAPTRPRPTFTLSDFLLPSEMARLHEKNSVLDECEAKTMKTMVIIDIAATVMKIWKRMPVAGRTSEIVPVIAFKNGSLLFLKSHLSRWPALQFLPPIHLAHLVDHVLLHLK
ncbi:hypothetical protein BDF19DRAFT_39796 [Syncephalis fuscata]|nr:hypothetical protein BDF19DRAFT_39796 [Syncephalis fuscata]